MRGQPAQLARGHGLVGQERRDSEAAAAQIPGTAGKLCHVLIVDSISLLGFR